MAFRFVLAALVFQGVAAQIPAYGQCGGTYSNGAPWTGPTNCCPSYSCQYINSNWWGCQETPAPPGTVARWYQCGGSGYTGPTTCQPGTSCTYNSPTFSRCETDVCTPVIASVSSSAKASSAMVSSSTKASSSTQAFSSTKAVSSSLASSSIVKVSSSIVTSSVASRSSSILSKSSSVASSSTKPTSSIVSSSIKLTSSTSSIRSSSSVKPSSTLITSTTTSRLSSSTKTTSSAAATTTSKLSSSTKTTSSATAATSLSCAVQNPPPPSAGKVSLTGINIAGCEFPGDVNAWNPPSGSYCPNGLNNWPDGPGQMLHFFNDDHFNTFRLPVSWQFLINSETPSSTLHGPNWATYDYMVQKCLITGAYCVVEVHNFGRFQGTIIGQGSGTVTNAIFAALWSNIAAKYAGNSKIIFGLMNEPHDLDINLWAITCQAAVTAIRGVETYSHMILLPGNNYASAGTFLTDGSAAALSTVTNPDGSFTNLVFDVHKYLDANNSGNSNDCPFDYISSAFAPLAQWLRCHGRRAFLTEIGGGNTDSCHTNLCAVVAFLNANSDVYVGYLGWGAGSFDTYHTITETPWGGPGTWSDQWIVTVCLVPSP